MKVELLATLEVPSDHPRIRGGRGREREGGVAFYSHPQGISSCMEAADRIRYN